MTRERWYEAPEIPMTAEKKREMLDLLEEHLEKLVMADTTEYVTIEVERGYMEEFKDPSGRAIVKPTHDVTITIYINGGA